jgi:hypothetical protein
VSSPLCPWSPTTTRRKSGNVTKKTTKSEGNLIKWIYNCNLTRKV